MLLYGLLRICPRRVQLSPSVHPASCWCVNVLRVFAFIPIPHESECFQTPELPLFWPSLCTSFSCTEYWIRRRALCSCSNSKEGNESGKRMTNYWVSVVAEVHAKQTCASCLLCVQGIPDHSPPGKLHASKNKIGLLVPGNTFFFFFPKWLLAFFKFERIILWR